jgi:trehalose synthase
MVISNEEYRKDDIPIKQSVIYPAIDPLTLKNQPINIKTISTYLTKFGIDLSRPIISQVSRFDKFKDPKGVLKVFELVRKQVDCQLVLLGSLAMDDPEGQKIFGDVERAREKSAYKDDIRLLLVENEILVNAVQSASTVVIQKSTREGFGLVVAEALYKKTPVVASNVGGIPFQVIDGVTGFLHKPNDTKGFAESILRLISDEKLRDELGENGHEHITKNFLITRLMLDWIDLFEQYLT